MVFRDVLVYVDKDKACDNRILSAINFSRHYGARLTGLYGMRRITIPVYPGAVSSAAMIDIVERGATEQYESAKKIYQEVTSAVELEAEFLALDGILADEIAVQSRYADLLVIPRNNNDEFDLNSIYRCGDVMLSAACPVLVVANIKPITLPIKSVMVAWDGSHESAIALRAAMPMLDQVEKIDLVSVSANDAEAMDITLHINRHGIDAETHFVESSQALTGKTLLEKAESLNSQLLVMGAYGHSRVRQMVLGGATKYVLENAELPILFSH